MDDPGGERIIRSTATVGRRAFEDHRRALTAMLDA
jgi:hypothetical protein